MAASIILILLPPLLYIFASATQRLQDSYDRDRVQQDVVSFIEEGKSSYDSGQLPITGVVHSHFENHDSSREYVLTVTQEIVHQIPIIRYKVEAMDRGRSIYELSTYLGPPLE